MSKAKIISAILALMAAVGLTGYTIVKKSDIGTVNRDVYHVFEVIDGDTIRVTDKDGERVRLLGLNAPEEGECYAKEAGAYLKKLIGENEVRLEKDISGVDQYGRLLRYVFVPSGNEKEDDVSTNEKLVREGYAVADAHPPDNRYRELLVSAEKEAREANRGMWGACEVLMTENEREQATQREIDMPPPSPECIIKGNISEKGYGKTYLVPGCDNYLSVKIDTRKGEMYFCTEKDAVSAGFRRADNCPQ